MEKYKNVQGGEVSRPVVMVCLSSSPSSKRVIRVAARTAFSMRGSAGTPVALYVSPTGREADEDSMLRENISYAREKGFEIHKVVGTDIPLAVADYARQAGVTDLFLGYSPPSFSFQARRPINDRLLSYLPSVDIHIIPDPVSSAYPGAVKRAGGVVPRNLLDLLRVLAVMAAATLLSFAFYHSRYSNSNIITIYILAVLIASVMTSSRIYGMLAAILYVLLFNFLFIEPRFTLLVYDSTYMMTYLVTMVAALITGTVTIRMKNIARMSAENAYQARILLDTSNKLEMAAGSEEIIRTTCIQLVHLLNRAVLLVPGSGPGLDEILDTYTEKDAGGTDQALSSFIFPAGEKTISPSILRSEAAAIRWADQNRHHSGAFTSHFSECSCRYLSIYSGENRFGVIGIDMGGVPFSEFENTILLSIVHECTMALENERISQEQKKAEILAENERLRSGLLRSISHDLRTPLTSICGNASNLLSHEDDLPPEDRDKIYRDIIEDASWLNAQFENILSMTRLESGRPLQKTVENMEDVIEESLRHMADHPRHTVRFDRPDQDLYAEIDPRLIMQVLVNLLGNAVKYTPPGSEVTVRMRPDGDRICVEVADNGPGIPDEDKPHIFDLFYTGQHALTDSYRSMGIGLNLCALIIRAHGGEIEVDDNTGAGGGALFRFLLPSAHISLPVDDPLT